MTRRKRTKYIKRNFDGAPSLGISRGLLVTLGGEDGGTL
jgi:hypothetical protein